MLSAVEIVELEKKVLKYRFKQRVHYILVGLLCVTLILAGFMFYPYFNRLALEVQKQPDLIKQNSTEPIIESNTTIITPVETNNSVKYTPEPVIEQKTDETLLLQLPTISNKNNPEKKTSYLPEPVEKKASFGIQEEELESKVLVRKAQKINEEDFYRSKEDKIDTSLLPPPLLEEPKQKGVIKIETHEVNSIQYLKEKFEKTHSIVFALMLAEEYYHTKNYNESNKWALIANNVDSENEKSWIWFAKSKLKLGHKEDAILALKAYLKNNKSKAAQSLLNQITLGEVID
jgi:hypothetical protein